MEVNRSMGVYGDFLDEDEIGNEFKYYFGVDKFYGKCEIHGGVRYLRDEKSFDSSENEIFLVAPIFEELASEMQADLYLFFGESSASRKTKIKSHKGLFYKSKVALENDVFESEVDCDDGYSRLVGGVYLPNREATRECANFNSSNSFFLLAREPIDTDCILDSGSSEKYGLTFDFETVYRRVIANDACIVVRWFSADNGRREALSIVTGSKCFFRKTKDVLDTILAKS